MLAKTRVKKQIHENKEGKKSTLKAEAKEEQITAYMVLVNPAKTNPI